MASPALPVPSKRIEGLGVIKVTAPPEAWMLAFAHFCCGPGDHARLRGYGAELLSRFPLKDDVRWSAGPKVRTIRGVQHHGIEVVAYYDATKGGQTYDRYWWPMEAFEQISITMQGERVATP